MRNHPFRRQKLWSREVLRAIRRHGPGQVLFWAIGLGVGIAAAVATVLFRVGIAALQLAIYGETDKQLASAASQLPWLLVLCVPIVGGLVTGFILRRYTPDGLPRGVAHVIEGAALRDGRVEGRAGLASAAASFITLSTGGSTGREGPVVHLAAVIASKVSRFLRADGMTARDLLGCATASAVAASFNAPIAGTIFAMEVVLRHYAMHAFGPIVIAAVAGAVISRQSFGDITEFTLPEASLEFYAELPAFALLGMTCGVVAVILMRAIFWTTDFADAWQKRLHVPDWARPALAGALLGAIAIPFPHVIGVGYETTSNALTGRLDLMAAVLFAVVKVAAVAITLAGRMGGGVFSPSLMVGALTGLAFGWVATGLFPGVSGTQTLYALAGMGAVAASVLGAPISTSLIVFEMTGDWQTGLAVMVAVALSVTISARFVARSFFLEQLEREGIHLSEGPHGYLPAIIPVADLVRPLDHPFAGDRTRCEELLAEGVHVPLGASLEAALPVFDGTMHAYVPVATTDEDGNLEIVGTLWQVDAWRAYSKAIAEVEREQHS